MDQDQSSDYCGYFYEFSGVIGWKIYSDSSIDSGVTLYYRKMFEDFTLDHFFHSIH